ncbi:hypothetical protein GUITHDRAFT_142183 [Guillardia theta CCMP2712]|uniref:Uncharacterized protein n=1 Tax=Guillardia theta (strain CCMP2712) TaxID=905079 RepID=L1IYY9_GUITC|nr:hypothetical protein GUITHDRAFT_142183 [Guillardia theta CCMP2712]EKX41277.1 hypothetical protein GUITHDRAFT_142183 [Guillardia theta CCMP2712]|eukprot:XP_005828257.1 hypothetical protein GUITHDRAFT_142183 [Guillardia theta CCMP2712]
MSARLAASLAVMCCLLATVAEAQPSVFYEYLSYSSSDTTCTGSSKKLAVDDVYLAKNSLESTAKTGNCYPTISSGTTYYVKMTCNTTSGVFNFESYTASGCTGAPTSTVSKVAASAPCEKGTGGDYVKYQGCAMTEADVTKAGYTYSAAPRTLTSWSLTSLICVALCAWRAFLH